MAATTHVITKNGNLQKVVGDKKKAIEALRSLAGADLKVANIGNLPVSEKNDVIAITGVAHWRIKVVPVE